MQLRDKRQITTASGHTLLGTGVSATWLAVQTDAAAAGSVVLGADTVIAAEGTRRGILLSTAGSKELRPLILQSPLKLVDRIYVKAVAGFFGTHCTHRTPE